MQFGNLILKRLLRTWPAVKYQLLKILSIFAKMSTYFVTQKLHPVNLNSFLFILSSPLYSSVNLRMRLDGHISRNVKVQWKRWKQNKVMEGLKFGGRQNTESVFLPFSEKIRKPGNTIFCLTIHRNTHLLYGSFLVASWKLPATFARFSLLLR